MLQITLFIESIYLSAILSLDDATDSMVEPRRLDSEPAGDRDFAGVEGIEEILEEKLLRSKGC